MYDARPGHMTTVNKERKPLKDDTTKHMSIDKKYIQHSLKHTHAHNTPVLGAAVFLL